MKKNAAGALLNAKASVPGLATGTRHKTAALNPSRHGPGSALGVLSLARGFYATPNMTGTRIYATKEQRESGKKGPRKEERRGEKMVQMRRKRTAPAGKACLSPFRLIPARNHFRSSEVGLPQGPRTPGSFLEP